jgi:UDP-2,3-diacylglucosamine hydrolase
MTAMSNEAQSDPVALFVSDVHLQPSLPRTTQAFLDFLRRHAVNAPQLYLLGDLFEYWAGDDDIATPYNHEIVDAVRAVSAGGTAVFWIGGNRDFLIGEGFAQAAGLTLLSEPFVTTLAGQRIVLMHGDAQCTDDEGYMKFRAMVRQPEWRRQFLAMPLAQRKAIIDGMREGSREAQRDKPYVDVNAAEIAAVFEQSGAAIMIHGHTHRPAVHEEPTGTSRRVRHVLPDWDCDTESPRGGWLALNGDGSISRFDVDANRIAS